jgi:hypothetical protein
MNNRGMALPDFYLERPAGPDEATVAAFGRLWRSHLSAGGGSLDYPSAVPRWQFLCWLADTQDVLLHGSGSPSLSKLEPRKSDDVGEFGARTAVYAASDGLWAMYFAVVDRRQVSSLVNACIRLPSSDGSRPRTCYYFSVDRDPLHAGTAWRSGFVYVLPREGFEREPDEHAYGLLLGGTKWASALAIRPVARLLVQPTDFPMLHRVHGHDPATVGQRAAANPDDFPWLNPA